MTNAEVEAIAGGYHGDPFRILGPHLVRPGRPKAGWQVRAFLPQAETAELVRGATVLPMQRLHSQGFFCVSLDTDPGAYRIRAKLWRGGTVEFDDPYRFPPLLTDFDLHLHAEGTNYAAYHMLGAHIVESLGVRGVRFTLWAPNAESVGVIGDFNEWDERRHPMRLRTAGVWELFIPALGEGTHYKYAVRSRVNGYRQQKADPYAFGSEVPPKSASVVRDLSKYQWKDQEWMEQASVQRSADAARSRSMRCTGNPGFAALAMNGCAIAIWPTRW